MYNHDLRVATEDVRRLGIVVNIGLVGRVYPLRRRWLTTHFLQPQADPNCPDSVIPLPLSLWNEFDDTFEHADSSILDELASWTGMSPSGFAAAVQQRTATLEGLSAGSGVDMRQMYDAIEKLRRRKRKATS
jgi:predicted amidophosphoribosyltransferase